MPTTSGTQYLKTLDQLLAKPRRLYGTHITIPRSYVVEVTAAAGFDFIIVDRQHVAHDLETAERLIQNCQRTA